MIAFNVIAFISFFVTVAADLDFVRLPAAAAVTDVVGCSTSFSSDGNNLAVGDKVSMTVKIFTRNEDVWSFDTQINNVQVGFGHSVSFDSSGSVLAVGSPDAGLAAGGAAYVYTKSGSVWNEVSLPTGGAAALVGQSVSLSGDGATVVVAVNTATGAGKAMSFKTDVNGDYLLNAETDIAADCTAVSLSEDAGSLAIGSASDNGDVGAVYVVTVAAAAHTLVGKYIGNDALGQSRQGYSVAMSSKGRFLAVGAPGDQSVFNDHWIKGTYTLGAVFMFKFDETTGSWSQMTDKLVGAGWKEDGQNVGMGSVVGISAIGESVVFAAPGDNGGVGASWLYARNGVDTFHFSQQGEKYAVGSASASISANGNEMAIVKDTAGVSANLNFFSEVVYMRIKIKLWGITMDEFPSETSTHALGVKAAFAHALGVPDDLVTRVQFKAMTGKHKTVECVATVAAHGHDFPEFGPIDTYNYYMLRAFFNDAANAHGYAAAPYDNKFVEVFSVAAGGSAVSQATRVGDVLVRVYFGKGF